MNKPQFSLLLCNVLNPSSDTKATFKRAVGVLISHAGKTRGLIVDVGPVKNMLKTYQSLKKIEIIDRLDCIAMPAFFDMHFHWVQDDVRLMPKDSLLTWLSEYTWPYEQKFSDKEYSIKRATRFAKELLEAGTLGGACFSSIHSHAVDHALKNFKGHFCVGNVLMDQNSPAYLTHTTKKGIDVVTKLATKYKEKYAITPRFAPTTTPKLMSEATKIGEKNNCMLQSHLSETKGEIEYVMSLYKDVPGFEKVKNYTEIYDRCGFLTPKTIMGHGIYLSDEECRLLRKRKTAIAHCPTSNAPVKEKGLGSGLFNFKKIESFKIPWALGSDIGGGPYLSMFDVMESFVAQNKKKKVKGATYTKALYRSTIAGAKILGLEKQVGTISKDKEANFIILPMPKKIAKETKIDAEDVLKEMIYPLRAKREKYQELVLETYHLGSKLYSKE